MAEVLLETGVVAMPINWSVGELEGPRLYASRGYLEKPAQRGRGTTNTFGIPLGTSSAPLKPE